MCKPASVHLESQDSEGGGRRLSLSQPGLQTKNLSEEKKERREGEKRKKKRRERRRERMERKG